MQTVYHLFFVFFEKFIGNFKQLFNAEVEQENEGEREERRETKKT